MGGMKHVGHLYSIVNLRRARILNDEFSIPFGDDLEIASELTSAIDNLFKKRSKCPNCGGIMPEINVLYKGKMFKFACYDIVRGRKSILKTDYEKLGKYLTGKSSPSGKIQGTASRPLSVRTC